VEISDSLTHARPQDVPPDWVEYRQEDFALTDAEAQNGSGAIDEVDD
jgi:hypothetical protein